jgi:hypothetical protein
MMKQNYGLMTVILLCTVLAIFLYERYMCVLNIRDAMTQPFLPEPFENVSDGWAISHIALYAILAYLFPSRLVLLFFIGVAWEILEETYGWIIRNTDYKPTACQNVSDKMTTWWYGRWHDLVSNSIGLLAGYGVYCLTQK